jgi:hypothetical protein
MATAGLDRRASVSLRDLRIVSREPSKTSRPCPAELIEQKAWAAQLRRTEGNLQQKQALVGWLEVRAAIYANVPSSGRIEREILLRKSAQALRFVKLSKPLRSCINQTIAVEVRYGRLLASVLTILISGAISPQ